MSLRLPYHLATSQRAVLTLGGRWVRPRPVIRVALVGPNQTRPTQGLLDTGSDDTVFPATMAAAIGLDLTKAPLGEAAGVGGKPIPLRYAHVTLRLESGTERREWLAWVGFTSAPLHYSLLGFAGFLQFFTATFHGDREEVELAVNALYPGT